MNKRLKAVCNRTVGKVILELAIFNFLFLGTEYLFDDRMTWVTDAQGVVKAQNYILGISVIGFWLFPVLYRWIKETLRRGVGTALAVLGVAGIFLMQLHQSYLQLFLSGCLVFVILGLIGGAVHYIAARELRNFPYLATVIGLAYALGILFQYLNHVLIRGVLMEVLVLTLAVIVLVLLLQKCEKNAGENDIDERNVDGIAEERYRLSPEKAGVVLFLIIVLMTCIFSTLDNAVTLGHADGVMDIGQWPRLLLAVSGCLAGFLFDIRRRKYMNLIMYCITLLSTICVVIIQWGGMFLVGLTVFYLSAGFFVVYFTTGFMELARYAKLPELWAGMGRAANNLCAIITGAYSVHLLASGSHMAIIIVALVLFMLLSVGMTVYTNLMTQPPEVNKRAETDKEKETDQEAEMGGQITEEEKLAAFVNTYSLTQREQEVLQVLLSSDENVQNIAEQLFISRAALYRHITSLNEKTETKSRIGLIQFYYSWLPSVKAEEK